MKKNNKIFFLKISIIIISIFGDQSINYFQKSGIGLTKFLKDGHDVDYINNFNIIKNRYSKDLFLKAFLNEISIITYDYTNKLNHDNKKVHIMVNLNDKYIYPLLVSINSALINSNKNNTTLVYHILCTKDIKKKNINKLKKFNTLIKF